MADDDLPTSLTRLTFHGPLSEARAARLVGRLSRSHPGTVLDVGCGWGELMLRILAVLPDAIGLGFDTDAGDLARARERVDAHRSHWLRGYRGVLGQAYLTLVPAG
jgi:cyclopropane fatty-acyl-phospholipid synthase-like methyltransferase